MSFSTLPLLLILLFVSAVLTGCADKDPVDPAPPLMTRADSIAAGLIAAGGFTVNGEWDGEDYYDFNGNPLEDLGVGGTDKDLDSPWGE